MNTDSEQADEAVYNFFKKFPLKIYEPKSIIVSAGQNPPGVMYAKSGMVLQTDIARNGSKIILNSFKAGAFFPMSWAINEVPNNYYFEALGHLEVHVAPKEEVLGLLEKNPTVVYDLLSRVFRGMDGILRQHSILIGADAQARILFSLITAARRFGDKGEDGAVLVDIDESLLAQQAGVSRETVSRQLAPLQDTGLLSVRRGQIRIADLKGLSAMLDDIL